MKINTPVNNKMAILAAGVATMVLAMLAPLSALASSPSVTTNGAVIETSSSVTLTGFVDSRDLRTTYWFELGKESGSFPIVYPSHSTTNVGTVEQALYNVTAGHTYYFRLVAQNKDGRVYGDVLTFNTGSNSSGSSSSSNSNTSNNSNTVVTNGSGGTVTIINSGSSASRSPSLVTSFATNVTDGSFTMNGFIDPNGGTSVYRWFEWGDTESLGNTSGYITVSSAPVNFSHPLTGLQPNRTYYFRAMGRNQYGIGSGNIYSVKTAQYGTGASTGGGVSPVIAAQQGSVISNTAIQMNGLVVPGSTTLVTAYFEWGTTQNPGNATPAQSVNASQATKLTHTLTNLSPNMVYYYRMVGQDSANRTYRSSVMSIATSFGGGSSVVAGSSTGNNGSSQGTNSGSKTAASGASGSSKNSSGAETAGVLFSKTASGIIGWFLAIIFFIISIVLGVMLKARGKSEEKEEPEFPEFPAEFHPQNIK